MIMSSYSNTNSYSLLEEESKSSVIDFKCKETNSFKDFKFIRSHRISIDDLKISDPLDLLSLDDKMQSISDGSDASSSTVASSTSSSTASSSPPSSSPPDSDMMMKDIVFYHERCVVNCTPSIAFGKPMQDYIENQVNASKNKWIYDILDGTREKDSVLIETDDFLFLPDTHAINNGHTYNWLSIVKDRKLRTLRDLDARHIPMLRKMKMTCLDYIQSVTQHNLHNIMAYVHYLPSVYQLHVHFCAPYGCYTTMDALKIYPLDSIISNLQIDGDYFKKTNITTVVYGNVSLLNIYKLPSSLASASSKFAIDLKKNPLCPCCKGRCSKCKGRRDLQVMSNGRGRKKR